MSAESDRLPFEPNKKRQKPAKTESKSPVTKQELANKDKDSKSSVTKQESGNKEKKKRRYTKEEVAIPKVVSQRMMRRVAGFAGVPTSLGIATLIVGYFLLSNTSIKLPPVAILLVNTAFFGLGVLGISYGVLSASWDEDRIGTLLGLNEFNTNFWPDGIGLARIWAEE